VAGAFVHDLDAVRPGAAGEFALDLQFSELGFVVGIGNRAGAQAVALMAIIQFNLANIFQIQLALKFSVNLVKAIKPQSACALNQVPAQP
jgi:hypothetical protein